MFHVLPRLSTDETWTVDTGQLWSTFCAKGIKKNASQSIAITVSRDFDQTTWMPKMKILCWHVCLVSWCILRQQQFQRRKAGVQQAGRRLMGSPRSMWVREWLSEDIEGIADGPLLNVQCLIRDRCREYTCFLSDYGPPPSSVTAYYVHVLSRFVTFTVNPILLRPRLRFLYAPWLPWQIFDSLKIWHGIYGNHGLSCFIHSFL